MKVNFIGGDDVQRSLNHSDNRCVNLVPSLNDKGDIGAYYGAAGLTLEVTNPSSAVGSGIYTASNGRCFEVAGTTLYELTETAGVISTTSRGTVTSASIYRMSDNGIELILVNGIDAWLFTFETNTLRNLKVKQAEFTVTIADPAVFTSVGHTLVEGDAIRLSSTTDSILSDTVIEAMSPSTVSLPILFGGWAIAASPDNGFVYATNGARLAMYLRNTSSGELSPLSPPYVAITEGLGNTVSGFDIALSSDGISAYVVAQGDTFGITRIIRWFDINTTTGQATSAGYIVTGGSYENTTSVIVSPDDEFVYSVNSVENTIEMFDRNLGTGDLSALTPATISVAASPQDIAISSDGIFAYITHKTAGTITVHDRVVATGLITEAPVQTIASGLNTTRIKISPDDLHVYALNNGAGTITMFSRDDVTGELTNIGTIGTGVSPSAITISVDGVSVYVSNRADNTVSQYIRDESSGLLTDADPATVSASSVAYGIAISPNGESVYVVGGGDISQFSRNGTATTIGLPTGLDELTTYYVSGQGLTADAFEVANTSQTSSHFVNPNAPATQTSPELGVGKYTLSMTGTGSIAVSEATATITGAGTATSSASVTFEVTVAGTVTYTVTGTPTTASAIGAALSTSGQQAGVHTFTTLGYGFPEGAKTVAYMNGRFIACEPNTQNFYVSEVLDGSWWDALNVQTVDSNPDNIVGEIVSHNELIVFCDDSGEVFYDSGVTPSPFVRNSSGIFEVGCVAPYSIANLDNQVFWLGGNKNGTGIVYKLQGYSPMRISTHSIEYAIQGMSDISDARAFAYQQDGHHFYVLSFQTGDKTFVYDVNTGLWHERANFADGSFSRWAAQEHAFFANKHLVLSYSDGKIYSLSNSVYTYGTEDRKWLRSFRVPAETMNRTRHTRLQLDCEAGVGIVGGDEPTVMLKWSDDGGHTWSNEVWRSMGIGAVGEYNKRVVWHRLGMTTGQPRIYEISGTAATKIVLLNVHLD